MPTTASSASTTELLVYVGYKDGKYVVLNQAGDTITHIDRLEGPFGQALTWRFWNKTNDAIDVEVINFTNAQQPGTCPVLLPGCTVTIDGLAAQTLSSPQFTAIVNSGLGVSSGTWTYEIWVSKGDGTGRVKLDPELQIDNQFAPPSVLIPALVVAGVLAALGWWWWRRARS